MAVADGLRIDVIRAFGFEVLLLTSGQRAPARRDLHFRLGSVRESPRSNCLPLGEIVLL